MCADIPEREAIPPPTTSSAGAVSSLHLFHYRAQFRYDHHNQHRRRHHRRHCIIIIIIIIITADSIIILICIRLPADTPPHEGVWKLGRRHASWPSRT